MLLPHNKTTKEDADFKPHVQPGLFAPAGASRAKVNHCLSLYSMWNSGRWNAMRRLFQKYNTCAHFYNAPINEVHVPQNWVISFFIGCRQLRPKWLPNLPVHSVQVELGLGNYHLYWGPIIKRIKQKGYLIMDNNHNYDTGHKVNGYSAICYQVYLP